MLDKQDALMTKEEEVVVVEPLLAAVLVVYNVALLDVHKNDKRELEGAVCLEKVERVGAKCIFGEL